MVSNNNNNNKGKIKRKIAKKSTDFSRQLINETVVK